MKFGKIYIVVLTLLVGGLVQAEHSLEPRLALPLFLKIITYDENFEPSKTGVVKIHLLYNKSDGSSYEMMIKTKEFFKKNKGLTVDKVPIELHAIDYKQSDSFWIDIEEDNYNVVIVAGISDKAVRQLTSEIMRKNIRTFSYDPDLIPEGIAVGIKMKQEKPAIFVNLNVSRAEGSRFSAHLLKMCQIYDEAR